MPGDDLKKFFQNGNQPEEISVDLIALIIKLLEEVRKDVSMVKDEQHSIIESFSLMEKNAVAFEQTLREHAEKSAERHKQILTAFPADDLDGHRRYHESLIEWRELRNKVIRDCLIQASKAAFGMAGLWMLYTLMIAFKFELKKWLG